MEITWERQRLFKINVSRLLKWLREINDRRGLTGLVVLVIWWYRGYVKVYTFQDHLIFNLWYERCNWAQLSSYTRYLQHGFTESNRKHCSVIQNQAVNASVTMLNVILTKFTNRYGTKQSCMRLVVSRGITFKNRWITIQESRTLTANHDQTWVMNPYREQTTYQKRWNNALWSAFTDWDT